MGRGIERGSSCCHVQRVVYVVVLVCRRGSWLFEVIACLLLFVVVDVEVIDCRLLVVVVDVVYRLLSLRC